MMVERFTLTEQHLALIQRLYIEWEKEPYEGYPVVNSKRPYGNSCIWEDVAEIIGINPIEDDDGQSFFPKGTREKCLALHRQVGTALQICVYFLTFETGVYVREAPWRKWEKIRNI